MRILLLSVVLLGSAPAYAQANPASLGASMTGQPTAYDVNGKTYIVDGYRSARWGMTVDQTRARIVADFTNARVDAPKTDPVDRTTVIVAHLPSFAPGPGVAAVTYVFGWKSRGLMHVNVDWSAEQATQADRAALTAAGAQVVGDFIAYYWKLLTVSRGIALGPHELSLFAATGEAGGLVEVRLQGVGYDLKRPDGSDLVLPPPADGQPALLHIGLAAGATPDIYRIKPGDF